MENTLVTIDEAKAIIAKEQAELEAKAKEYRAEYDALCTKYGLEIQPQTQLVIIARK